MYKNLIKPFLFLLDPEKAHHFSVSSFRVILKIPILAQIVKAMLAYEHPKLEKELWGIRFPNPIGLAAGFDKDGKYFNTMASLGFGFIEIGTVTPKPQDGNPKKRLFRLPADSALINRMGFNNEGVDTMAKRLKSVDRKQLIVGGNIGKNKVTPNENATEDYVYAFEALYPHVDYFVVNVSSPNTPGLRELQDKEPLTKLLQTLMTLRDKKSQWKPVCLKIAPDLSDQQLEDIFDIIRAVKLDGIIATNTTIDRTGLQTSDQKLAEIGAGGLSGAPLSNVSSEVVRKIRSNNKEIPIIGVGGISSPEDAYKMLNAGADLIQIYTGLVYQGPAFVKNIKKYIVRKA